MPTTAALRSTICLGMIAAGLTLAAGTASAHVGISEDEVEAGSYAVLTFGLPHGCGQSPVTELRIQIPEPILSVTPTRNANWEVTKVMTELDEPVAGAHGESVTERVSEVVYTALTPLDNGYRDAFELSLRIPEETAGTTLYFPSVQTCVEGETAWIEIPTEGQDPHELDAPSPSVKVIEASGDAHGHGDGSDAAGEESHDHSADAAHSDDAAAVPEETTAELAAQVAAEVATEIASEIATDAVTNLEAATPSEDGSSNALAVVAVIIGGLGLTAGAASLIRARRT